MIIFAIQLMISQAAFHLYCLLITKWKLFHWVEINKFHAVSKNFEARNNMIEAWIKSCLNFAAIKEFPRAFKVHKKLNTH